MVPPRMWAYSAASKAVFEVFEHTSPLVEGLSIDEAFLDVGGLGRVSGSPVRIAVALRRDVKEQVGLVITVGVARTKFLAKVASAVAKPDGDAELSDVDYQRFEVADCSACGGMLKPHVCHKHWTTPDF